MSSFPQYSYLWLIKKYTKGKEWGWRISLINTLTAEAHLFTTVYILSGLIYFIDALQGKKA